MKNLFSIDSPLFQLLTTIGDLVAINVMWLLASLPLFTIGASSTALYHCITKLQKDGSIKVLKEFYSVFRKEFKQATLLWGILFLVLFILILDFFVVFSLSEVGMIGQVLVSILAFLIIPAACYVFPLQAHFENRVLQTLKNAWLMSMSHFPISLAVALIHLIPVILLIIWPAVFFRSFIVWLLLGGSLIAYFSSLLLRIVFKRYETSVSEKTTTD